MSQVVKSQSCMTGTFHAFLLMCMDLTTQLDEIKKLLSASPGPGTSPLRLILPIRPVQIGKESIVETVVVSHLVPPVDVPWSLNELHVSSQHVDCQGSSVSLLRLVLAASMPSVLVVYDC
mmetsp:Transcript_13000/g.29892  ORF Transcript_13000/g.29892 Transcript_13000/m.29892 type:complete len:120 (-) Transcript_13000:830-1189(-)